MWTVGQYQRELLAGPITAQYVLGEMAELVEAVKDCDLSAIREEWSDVALVSLCWLARFVAPLRVLPFLPGMGGYAAEKFARRSVVWVEIFQHHGLVFRKEYTLEGGNYRKRHKVLRVLAAGGYDGAVDWDWIAQRVGGFEE